MANPALEVADIFREHGPAWREAQRGHLSLGQLKVMSAIEQCRSAALGGHVLRCGGCGADQVSYNSCRNRHCPKCQSSAAKRWLDARQADLLPSGLRHAPHRGVARGDVGPTQNISGHRHGPLRAIDRVVVGSRAWAVWC